MYKLYWSPGSANMVVHALLREIGADVEMINVDIHKGDQRSAGYLKLNPHARVPTLIYDGDKVIYESAAITQFLVERHPEIDLAPLPGHPDRGAYLQWMAYLTNTLQEAAMHYWHNDNFIDGAEEQAKLKAHAEQRIARIAQFLDDHLAAKGPYLCGGKFYACDYFLAMLARWTRLMAQPLHGWPHLNKLIRAALDRPAYQRMLEEEGIDQPV
jgi:glutathione S-transferase